MGGPVELRAMAVTDVVLPMAVGTGLLGLGLAGVLGGPAPPLLWLGLAGLALGVAPCLDDPAAAVTAAAPLSERRRRMQRLTVLVLVVAGWCAYAWLVDGRERLSGPHLLLTGCGVLVGVAAAASTMRRLGHAQPGAAVGPLAVVLIVSCLLFQPLPGDVVVLQAYAGQSQPAAWIGLVALCLAVLWWSSGDPGGSYTIPTRLRLSPGKTVAEETPKRASTTSASTLR